MEIAKLIIYTIIASCVFGVILGSIVDQIFWFILEYNELNYFEFEIDIEDFNQ